MTTTTAATDDRAAVATVLLVGGHESRAGTALEPLVAAGVGSRAVPPGRSLCEAVGVALANSPHPVCAVPMTLGRDPRLVADTARALHWCDRPETGGRIALAEPFGTQAHLVGWLRAAAGRFVSVDRDRVAVLVTAPAGGPFDDADLFRVARLVGQYGRHRWVEVAFDGGDPDPARGVERVRRLGADRTVLVPAAFGSATSHPPPGAEDIGPLLATAAVGEILLARAGAALRRLERGDDGVHAGLAAEHGYGHAHTHDDGAPHQRHAREHTHPTTRAARGC